MKPANEQLRDAPRALEFARQANIRSGQRSARFLRTLARALMANGERDAALRAWEDALASASEDQSRAMTLNYAANEFLNAAPAAHRDPRQALEFSLRANALSRYENPGYLSTLALAHHRLGETDEAVTLQKRAMSLLAPESPDRAEYEDRLDEFQAASEGAADQRRE